MKRICAYCRVSTDSKDQENSFENQQKRFNRIFNSLKDVKLINIFADRGISGTKINRPEFDKMLKMCGITRIIDDDTGKASSQYKISGESQIDEIYVTNISRFGRNLGGTDTIIKMLLENHVYLVYIVSDDPEDEEIYSTKTDSGYQYIQRELQAAEWFSRDLSRKVKAGMKEGMEKGNIYVGQNIYGYYYLPHPENRLTINEEEAEVVRLIYDLYVHEGLGTERIARELGSRGIVTRKKKGWSSTAIMGILKNVKYAGYNDGGKYTKGKLFEDRRLQHRPVEKQYRYKCDKIPAIIDISLYEEAQKIRENSTAYELNKGRYLGKSDYAGLIKCGLCGSTYQSCGTKRKADKTIRYYACRHRYRYDTAHGINRCENPTITQNFLDSQLTSVVYLEDRIASIAVGIERLQGIRKIIESRIDQDNIDEVKELKAEVKEYDLKLEKLVDLYIDGNVERDIYEKRRTSLQNEKGRVLHNMELLSKDNDEIYKDLQEIDKIIESFNKDYEYLESQINDPKVNNTYSRKQLLKDVSKITVWMDGDIEIKFKSLEIIDSFIERYSIVNL